MRTLHICSSVIIFLLFSSFNMNDACQYAASNINYVRTQTEAAISQTDINLVRYYTYKALGGIDKSNKQLAICGCEYASIGIEESSYQMKRAVKATSLVDAKKLLNKALETMLSSLEAIKNHDLHVENPTKKLLAMNTGDNNNIILISQKTDNELLQELIDTSLENYRISLDKVIETVDCNEARAFAERIYRNCEKELLKATLSEGKKYYNLKTQEITSKALTRLGACYPTRSK